MMLITIILHTDLWDTDTQILQYDATLSALFELLFYVCLKIKNKKILQFHSWYYNVYKNIILYFRCKYGRARRFDNDWKQEDVTRSTITSS